MAERWTRTRRVEHTRTLLLQAAEEVFAQKGFDGAALDDIADAAGYTRGAIHAHFGTKEVLFLAVTEQHRQRYIDAFSDVISSFHDVGDIDADRLGQRWHELARTANAADSAALGLELTLFLQRNPDARARVAEHREETTRALGDYIAKSLASLGGAPTVAPIDLARVLVATADALVLGSHLDDVDLFRPFMTMFLAGIRPPS